MAKKQINGHCKYPENLKLKQSIRESGRSITHLAGKIGICRELLSNTVNGHRLGRNVIPKLMRELGIR